MTRRRFCAEQPAMPRIGQGMDISISNCGLTSRAAPSLIENGQSKSIISDASSGSNMVSVGRTVGICGHHFAHGDGKLDLPGAERDSHSSRGVSRDRGEVKYIWCHCCG